jgi:hypothetical protein
LVFERQAVLQGAARLLFSPQRSYRPIRRVQLDSPINQWC